MGIIKKWKNEKTKKIIGFLKKELDKETIVVHGEIDKETKKKLKNNEARVIQMGTVKGDEFKTAMDEYNYKYGKLPGTIYNMPLEKTVEYLIKLMKLHEKGGINTLDAIEGLIKKKEEFKGVHARGIIDKDGYKIHVSDKLIYDSSRDFFDSEYKRLQIFSEIQGMIAQGIYGKDLKQIRKEKKTN